MSGPGRQLGWWRAWEDQNKKRWRIMERQKRRRMLTAPRHSRGVIARCLDSSVVSGLYHARIFPCSYSTCVCVCKALCACVCVHCSHRQTHGSLRSGEYYRGVDHRGTRPIANRQAPLINPFHTDASPLRLCLSLSVNLSFFLPLPLNVCLSRLA